MGHTDKCREVEFVHEYLDQAYLMGQEAYYRGEGLTSYPTWMAPLERDWFKKGWTEAEDVSYEADA